MILKILAEANPKIGMGHFIRSLALADMVSSMVDVSFFGRDGSFIKKILYSKGYSFTQLGDLDSFCLGLDEKDIVLLDGYDYKKEFQKRIRQNCNCLLVIDDLHDRVFHADYIINHAPGIGKSNYRANEDCKFLLGPDYALLREPFLRAENNSGDGQKALVCFGGADPRNLSLKLVKQLLDLNESFDIHVIVGSAYAFHHELKEVQTNRRVSVSIDLDEFQMAENLRNAKFAIVPTSGILYECLAVGTQAISGYYTLNQKEMYWGWLNAGGILGVEDFDETLIKQKISLINSNTHNVLDNHLIDHRSPERFREIFYDITAGK